MGELLQEIRSYLELDETWVAWALGLSVLTFIASLIAVPVFVIRMDSDFFVRKKKARRPMTPGRVLWQIGKNLLGVVLILAGIAMLILPGQGLLTIALGVSLMSFPGKRAVKMRFARIPQVHRSMNWIRRKANRPPLELPERS